MTLNITTRNFADGTLTLNFTAAMTIPAGTPFIIKWDESGTDITSPVFEDVTVDATKRDATIDGVLNKSKSTDSKDSKELDIFCLVSPFLIGPGKLT